MSNQIYQYQWKIVGKAGEGEMVSTKLLAKVLKRLGLSVFAYYEYPSLIKGGHQTGQVFATAEQTEFICQRKQLNMIVALNKVALDEHSEEIVPSTVVVVNHPQTDANPNLENQDHVSGSLIHKMALSELARVKAHSSLATNIAVLGVTAWCMNIPEQFFLDVIAEEFKDKGDAVIVANQQVFEAALALAKEQLLPQSSPPPKCIDQKILLTGNEAIGLGAIAGGVQFYSAYPMTPASGLMHYLAEQQQQYPIIVKHAEDEIAAINQAIGASFAGVRAMTGSAGGGFALMVESVSLLGVTELPLVIMVGQRPGPATGLPTWTTQADLQFILHSGHGEFPRVVLTPGSIQEHYQYAKLAFELAEKYQLPVFIVSDKYLLESHQTMMRPENTHAPKRQSMMKSLAQSKEPYHRYKPTITGISPRSIPGQVNGLYMANSYEHDEHGFASESAENAKVQNQKRLRKLAGWNSELPAPKIFGSIQAPICLVSWGSTVNVTASLAEGSNGALSAVHLPCVWPFPANELAAVTAQAQKIIVVEGNATGQLEQLINQETDIVISDRLRRFDGRPFYGEEIIEWLMTNYGLLSKKE